MKEKCKHISAHLSTEPIENKTYLACDDCDYFTDDPSVWAEYELLRKSADL